MFNTLLFLVKHNGHLVEKDELMKEIWPDHFVEEIGLTRNISMLRKVLGDDPAAPRYIETVPKLGYRFVGPVLVVEIENGAPTTELQAELRVVAKNGDESRARLTPEDTRGAAARTDIVETERPAVKVQGVARVIRRRWRKAAVIITSLTLTATALTYYYFVTHPYQTNRLVSWWPGRGNANDIVGVNHGTLQNGATFSPGRVGPAFSFDGIDDHVSVPDAPNMQFGTREFTVRFWVNFNDLENNGNGIIHKDSYTGAINGTYKGWLFNICDSCPGRGGIGFETRDIVKGRGPDTHARYATSNFETGRWYHIAGVRKSSTLHLYVDGALRASVAEAVPTNVSNEVELNFGSLSAGGRQYFKGLIEDIRVYNVALAADEINLVARGGIGLWRGEGSAIDNVGAGNGTSLNGASFAAGKFGKAFSFDGIDDCVSVGNPTSFNLTQAITVAAWVKPGDFPEGQFATVLAKWSAGTNNGSYGMWLIKQDGDVKLLGGIGVAHVADGGLSGGSVPLNEWSHVAMTYDSAAAKRVLYVNGQQVVEQYWPGGILPSNQHVLIGSDSPGFRPFHGLIDEVQIYNRALTAEEIRDVFDAGTPPAGLS